ncbi:MAG: NUDIX domain-containing protein [Ruminococcaceae bacterium]|nr:NUDIX domain-containing protein [Oscillospiraceae bacterium]
MAGWNVAASNRSARFILGKTVTADISSTFRKQLPGKGVCFVNYGKVRADENDSAITEKQAFVIGTHGPVSVFTGEVVAVVKTPDKREYWVVGPKNSVYYEPDLRFLVSGYIDGVEDKDEIVFVSFNEKSCGAVLFTLIDGKRYYILIRNMSGHVGFPKGHVELGEDENMTALREIYEETGVNAKLIKGFRESYNYLINGYVRKEAVYYTAPFNPDDVKMDIMEISEYKLATYEEAMKLLNYPHDRSILRRANDFISGYLAAKAEDGVDLM